MFAGLGQRALGDAGCHMERTFLRRSQDEEKEKKENERSFGLVVPVAVSNNLILSALL